MRLIILGPQASGKGTQAEMLATEFGLVHVSTGEQLRKEVASGSPLGKKIKEKIDKGELVPDELVEKMIEKVIAGKGFILDGFPRTVSQAQWLDLHANIDKVIVLNISDKTAIERIGGRRECPKGHDYHIIYNPPKKQGVCDEDGLPLSTRADDKPEAIKKRLQTYHQQTEPLVKFYKKKLFEVDGERSIQDVHGSLLQGLRH